MRDAIDIALELIKKADKNFFLEYFASQEYKPLSEEELSSYENLLTELWFEQMAIENAFELAACAFHYKNIVFKKPLKISKEEVQRLKKGFSELV